MYLIKTLSNQMIVYLHLSIELNITYKLAENVQELYFLRLSSRPLGGLKTPSPRWMMYLPRYLRRNEIEEYEIEYMK